MVGSHRRRSFSVGLMFPALVAPALVMGFFGALRGPDADLDPPAFRSIGWTLPAEAPGVPAGLLVTSVTETSVTVSWGGVSAHGASIQDFVIDYSADGVSWTRFADGVSSERTATITGLTQGVAYRIRVAAVNSVGQGPFVDLISASIDVGSGHTCAAVGDGTARCWGEGGRGQLGYGSINDWREPVEVSELTGAVEVSVGDEHSCALLGGGGVRCWGYRALGRLGNGFSDTGEDTTPAVVTGLSDAVAIGVGGAHSCAVASDGSAWCWGENNDGELGDGTSMNRSVPTEVAISDVVDIAAGKDHTCAVLLDGSAFCWGSNVYGQLGNWTFIDSSTPVTVSGVVDAVSITAGDFHTCILRGDGGVTCFGKGSDGQLGTEATLDTPIPEAVSITGVVAVSAGSAHTCAAKEDGSAWCWGANPDGRLGDGTKLSAEMPMAVVGASDVVAIAAGRTQSCAMAIDVSPTCWGDNSSGKLGDFTFTSSAVPVAVVDGFPVPVGGVPLDWNPSVAIPALAPDAPTGLQVLSKTGTSVELGWTAPADDGGRSVVVYQVEQSLGGDQWTVVDTPATTSMTVTGLERGVAVSFRVAAISAAGMGSFSSETSVTPATVPMAPRAPIVTGSTATSISLEWNAPDDGGSTIVDYVVQYSVASTWTTFVDDVTPSTSAVVTGLTRGLPYRFRIAAINGEGTGPFQLPIQSITAGGSHSCVILSNSTVKCWGDNGWGQLGTGQSVPGSSPSPLAVSGSADVVSVGAGHSHSCAVMNDWTVDCWGSNSSGQLGIGSRFPALSAPGTVTGLADVVGVEAGISHTCAWTGSGRVLCWGSDFRGQLGRRSVQYFSRVPVDVAGLETVVDLAAGGDHTCAVGIGGQVWCWGANDSGQLGTGDLVDSGVPVRVPGLDEVISVTAGEQHTCAVRADRTARCWGEGSSGRLGNGSSVDSSSPVAVTGLTGVESLDAGSGHTCAVRLDGAVLCWGLGASGRLGNGGVVDASTPQAVTAGPVASLSAGGSQTCVVLRDSSVMCWGSNESGQLGDGTKTNRTSPVAVPGLSASGAFTTWIPATIPGAPGTLATTDRTWNSVTLSWDAPDDGGLPVSDYVIETSVDGSSWSEFADGTATTTSATVTGLTKGLDYQFRVSAVNARGAGEPTAELTVRIATVPLVPTDLRTTAVTATSVTLAWDAPDDGGSPITDYIVEFSGGAVGAGWQTFAEGVSSSSTTTVTGLTRGGLHRFRVSAVNDFGSGLATAPKRIIDMTTEHACAVTSDTTVVCWGRGDAGQRGDETWTNSNEPVPVTDLTGVVEVATGGAHSCALLAVGTVLCWGDNTYGQLGNGSNSPSSTPVEVPGLTDVVSLAAGGAHTCVTLVDGSAKCWGYNGQGQLGHRTLFNRNSPTPVVLSVPVVSIAAGANHTCALVVDRTVRCWGYNAWGQLGDGSSAFSTLPVKVSGLNSAVMVRLGSYHSCAVLADATAECWGYNGQGQLGDGTGIDRSSPVDVTGVGNIDSISPGLAHTCIVTMNRSVWCWGFNYSGQLGNGTTTDSLVPVRSPATDSTMVAAGWEATVSIKYTGSGRSWGANGYGQLGDGTVDASSSPVIIKSLAVDSPFVTGIPRENPGAPSAPVREAVTANSVTVSWSVPASDGGSEITSYTVTSTPGSKSCSWSSGPLSCTVSELTTGTAYTFVVIATNAVGDSVASTSSASIVPAGTPSAATSLVATAGVGSASIAFTPGADGGAAITKYQVKVGNGSWTDAVGTSSPITITGLTNFVSASIRLRAVNSAGIGAASVAVAVIPRLAGPTAANATASGRTGIVVTFNLNPLPGTTVAYQSVVAYARGTNTVRGTCRTYARQTTCYIGGLTRATTYDLRVTAHLSVPGKTWHHSSFEGSILEVRTNR